METAGAGAAVAPPRLAPVSGVLSQGQGVIKPIACRPVVSSANTTPVLGNRPLASNQPTTSPAGSNNNGRSSWGLYNSTSDLRSPTSAGSRGPHLQRFSWSKGPNESEMGMLCARPVAVQQHQQPPTPRKLSDALPPAGSITSINSASNANGSSVGRVADLSRRFGGSLSSVAAPPNSPTPPQIRQPPAYRPPPSSARSSAVRGSPGQQQQPQHGGVSYSSSELHLDRVSFSCARPAPNGTSTPQWVLGGSEVNLSCLSRSTLPRHQQQHEIDAGGLLGLGKNGKGGLLLSAYDPHHNYYNPAGHHGSALMGSNGSRSSWAGLPSVSKAGMLNSSNASSNGSSSTLLSASFERREDAATPIVEEGRIRSMLGSNGGYSVLQMRTRKQSNGSLDEDFDCCDGGSGNNSVEDGTPSPSDSGVAELEVLLKEKDCEIALLRETLEQNEAVIFQVYQEKEKSWERELKKLRSIYEDRMRSAQQQASQAERQLQTQSQQWQSDRKQLKQQVQQLKSQCEQVQSRLDETSWTLCQKSGEISLLKSQLKDAQGEQSQRCQEMAKLRSQLKESQEMAHNTRQRLEQAVQHGQNKQQLDNRRSITSPILSTRKLICEPDQMTGNSANDSQRLQRRLAEIQQSIDTERQVWHEEKATVLVYQRHLQQQYVQAMKRNQQLEEALGMLGITGVPSAVSQQQKQPPMSSPKSNCSDPITIDLDSSSNSSSAGETHC